MSAGGAAAPPPPPPPPGGSGLIAPERIQRLECIGRGSYGDVYRGVDTVTGQQVAIKVIDLEDM